MTKNQNIQIFMIIYRKIIKKSKTHRKTKLLPFIFSRKKEGLQSFSEYVPVV